MDEYIKREDVIKHLRGACIVKYPLSFSYGIFASADEISKLPPADVVPKSEVEKLQKQLAEMLVSEQTELHIPMEYLVRVRTEHPIYKAIKTEVARKIFADFTKHKVCTNEEDFRVLDELKKKYAGDQT